MLNESLCTYIFVCIVVTFIKNFSRKVHCCYTCICIFTYPHLCNVIMVPFSPVLVSTPHSRKVS
jgi:hypothetical protein